ncbi:M15 family metallopeptidase [Oxalobacteraceae bacterium R-40]|uniref:M15 family metallopeptidase n=1 Tax=Keguizhuia sedimenti TaxID=3064264 RepID=A0ABU1BMC1_9BURK|nr:M15 family metallopeptidase [Oxalobacteraceae bacterium R-40]
MRIFSTVLAILAGYFLSCLPAQAGTISEVSEAVCTEMKTRSVLKADSPVPCRRLRVVYFSYLGFDGKAHHDGEIVVLDAAADDVSSIFEELFRRRFPIGGARAMEHYDGDDTASMRDNNTSGFNHRALTGGGSLSVHAYGLAIDINPVQNPYIAFAGEGQAKVSPEAGSRYANRARLRPGKPERQGMAEDIVHVFAHHGFVIWGGDWDNPIDYQHFQISRKLAEQLAALPADKAREIFRLHVKQVRDCMRTASKKSSVQTASIACRQTQ